MKLYKTHTDLPKYVVTSGDLPRATKCSYGICLRTKDGKRLAIKPMHSYAFITLMRGVYHQASIPHMISLATKEEYDTLIKCIEEKEIFDKMYFEVNGQNECENKEYAYERLMQSEQMLRRCSIIQNSELCYYYPKGQQKKRESNICCALRELEEETGISLKNVNYTFSGEEIKSSVISSSGLQYKVKIFVIDVDEEIAVDFSKRDKSEVSEIKWISDQELIRM